MAKTKLFIFDIDGTLTDSIKAYHEAFIVAMKKIGITQIDTNFNDYKHHTDSYVLKVNFENNHKRPLNGEVLTKFETAIMDCMVQQPKTKEIAGAQQLIEYLRKETEHAIVFATGSLIKPAMLKLQHCNIWFQEELIATSNTAYDRESIVNMAIDKAQKFYGSQNFEQIISIGDGIWDLKTARNLSLDFVGIGPKNKQLLLENGTELHFNDMTEYWKHLNR